VQERKEDAGVISLSRQKRLMFSTSGGVGLRKEQKQFIQGQKKESM
jgi:hypothetical protein